MWGSLDPKLWSRSQFFQPTLLYPHIFPPETTQIDFFRKDPVSCIPAVGEAQKPGRKAKGRRGTCFWIFSENFETFSAATSQIWIFLKNLKCKGIFVKSSWCFCILTHPGILSLALYPDPFKSYDWSYLLRQNFGARGIQWDKFAKTLKKLVCGEVSERYNSLFLLILVTATGGRPKLELYFLLGQLRWTLFSMEGCGKKAVDRTPNLTIERRTLYHWAIVALSTTILCCLLFQRIILKHIPLASKSHGWFWLIL